MTRAALALLLLLAAPVQAGARLDEAESLYRDGNMLEAARLAGEDGTAGGFALAARALLVEALYVAPESARLNLLDEAAAAAAAALERDPEHVFAMLHLAVALGQKAELKDPLSAHVSGYAETGRTLIERALDLAPDHPWATGLLGIWHLQVVRFGGDTLADSIYDASREEGRRLCARALDLAPDAAAIRFGCARSLLDIDAEAYRDDAMAELRVVLATPATDEAGRLIRAAAWALIRDLRLASR